jgi:uncharacterized membrane protein YdbT with pleckstrin-like domain
MRAMPTVFVKPKGKSFRKPFTPDGAPPTHMGPLTAFAVNPMGLRFETQEEEEKVILFLRQHIIVNVPWILITILLIIAPTVIFPKLFDVLRLNLTLPSGYYFIGTIFWYLATFGFALASFIGWFFNIYIVTNERIVDIDFYYLLYKKFSEAELTKIQDISFTSGGILAAIFNFGNVTIETAGEMPNIQFEAIPFPEKAVETIRSLTEVEEGEAV